VCDKYNNNNTVSCGEVISYTVQYIIYYYILTYIETARGGRRVCRDVLCRRRRRRRRRRLEE